MADQDSDAEEQEFPMEIENGHITDSNSGAEGFNSSDDDQQAVVSNSTGEYDKEIPTSHGYLGKLDPLTGYTIFEDGDVLREIFAMYTNTLVFPGFTLPLVMNNYVENRVLEKFIEERNKVFILLCADTRYNDLFEYGITMEIFETNRRNNLLQVKAKGRQRCKRIAGTKIEFVAGRIKLVTVQILAEPPIVGPLDDTQLLALKSRRQYRLDKYEDLAKCRKYRRYHLGQFTQPSWVYELNEVSYHTKILVDTLSSLYGKELVPTDPEKLSYWFVQNYHLDHQERLQVLCLRSTLERLKLEVKFLRLDRYLCCMTCQTQITDPTKVFAMSKDGIQSNYVNPGGHVYETVTVTSVTNIQLVGTPSRQFSWFPGYSWTILQCCTCQNHLGWKFTSTNLTPKEFYGLASSGVKVISSKKTLLTSELIEGRKSYAPDYIDF